VACEIGILTTLIYSALLFVRGTRASPILAGLVILMILLSLLSRMLGLDVMEFILMKTWTFLAVGALIIFQPEIRRAFAELGSQQTRLRGHHKAKREKELITVLLDAAYYLANHRNGALIAIEQNIGTRAIAETGTYINAPVSKELLASVFYPNAPLHDGGVIIHEGLIVAAGCIFPLTQAPDLSKSLGTRHRAGVGITEETDAVAIIVSEESGAVSMAYKGRLIQGVSRHRLERHLTYYLVRKHLARTRGGLVNGIGNLQKELTDDDPSELHTEKGPVNL